MKVGWTLGAALMVAAGTAVIPVTASASPHAQVSSSLIQHIVVLMQENHTFDNELGDWCKQTGRCAGLPAQVTLSDGTVVTPGVTPDIVPKVDHDVAAQIAAVDGGRMDGWQNVTNCEAPAYACISYFPASSVPNLTSLASSYGVEDRAFTQSNSPSWGGHLDLLAGTTDGFTGDNPWTPKGGQVVPGWGCDSYKVATYQLPSGRFTPEPSCIPDYSLGMANGGAFEPTRARAVPTILDRMDAAGVGWNIYAAPPGGGTVQWSGCPSFASCLYTGQLAHLVPTGQFFTDAAAGALPAVSFLIPAGKGYPQLSQHNLQSNAAGDNWIGKIASTVMNSPDWPSTALIITYDDCGCFYDKVPPPLGPDGRQMGPRVPFVLVSPYAKRAYTDSTPTSSTGSILALIESTFGLPPMGANDRRAYNLSRMFNFAQKPRPPIRMVWRKLPKRDYWLNQSTAREAT